MSSSTSVTVFVMRSRFVVGIAVVAAALLGSLTSVKATELDEEVRVRVAAATVFVEASYRPASVAEPAEGELFTTAGSGFVIAREGLVLTNAHVVDAVVVIDAETGERASDSTRPNARAVFVLHALTVRTHSGSSQSKTYPASIVCTRPMPQDLALLRIRAQEKLQSLPLVDLTDFGKLRITQPVWAIGFPMGRTIEAILAEEPRLTPNIYGPDISIRSGAITALRRDEAGMIKVIGNSCLVEPGNSGGPLVDAKGRVVGVNYYGGGRAFSFAVPTPVLQKEFRGTLDWRRDLAEGGRRVKARVLRVDHDNEAAYRTIAAALSEARNGDTIELAEGSFQSAHPLDLTWRHWGESDDIPRHLWIHGAGQDKTTILSRSATAVIFGGSGCLELSDLSIGDESLPHGALLVEPGQPTSRVFIHDINVCSIAGPTPTVDVANGARIDLVGVSFQPFGGGVACGKGSVSRVERVENIRWIRMEEAKATFEGCDFAFVRFELDSPDNFCLRGCRVSSHLGFDIRGGQATLESNNLDCGAIALGFGCRARLSGNGLLKATRVAVVGEESRAEIIGNTFECHAGGVSVSGGAEAEVTKNLFVFTAYGGAGIPVPHQAGKDPAEARRDFLRQFCYGLGVSDEGTRARYAANTFLTSLGAVAVKVSEGADGIDAGGNQYEGNGQSRVDR